MNKKCERCKRGPGGGYTLLDYCVVCSKDLCEECMKGGCCGNVPARSGTGEDYQEEEDSEA